MGFLQGCFGSLAEFKLVSRVCRIGQEGEIRFAYLSHHIDTWVGREWAEVDLQLPHVAAIINVVNGDSTNGTSHIVPGRIEGIPCGAPYHAVHGKPRKPLVRPHRALSIRAKFAVNEQVFPR